MEKRLIPRKAGLTCVTQDATLNDLKVTVQHDVYEPWFYLLLKEHDVASTAKIKMFGL